MFLIPVSYTHLDVYKRQALQGGKQIQLPYTGELEIDALTIRRMKEIYGVDPLDMEAMMSYVHQKP